MKLKIDVFSDVVCPWCYVGKRRLEKAIAEIGNSHQMDVSWLPFQLNPQIPDEGIDRNEYRIRKFGSLNRSRELEAQVIAAGQREGIQFAFDRIARIPNTRDAHRLIWLAQQRGLQDAIVEEMFQSYFVQGNDFTKPQVLRDAAVQAGLELSDAEKLLRGRDGLEALQDASEQARRTGIQGVPFFIINGEMMLSGAQPSETLVRAFRHALASA